jgi:hypothetical protein
VVQEPAQDPYPAVSGTGGSWKVPDFVCPDFGAAGAATGQTFTVGNHYTPTSCSYSGVAQLNSFSDIGTKQIPAEGTSAPLAAYGPGALFNYTAENKGCNVSVPMSNGHFLEISASDNNGASPSQICASADKMLHLASTQG